jgi:hypothetical protein
VALALTFAVRASIAVAGGSDISFITPLSSTARLRPTRSAGSVYGIATGDFNETASSTWP